MHISLLLLTHLFRPPLSVCTTLANRPTCHAQNRCGSSTTSGWCSLFMNDRATQAGLLDELKRLEGYVVLQRMQRICVGCRSGRARYVRTAMRAQVESVMFLRHGAKGRVAFRIGCVNLSARMPSGGRWLLISRISSRGMLRRVNVAVVMSFDSRVSNQQRILCMVNDIRTPTLR